MENTNEDKMGKGKFVNTLKKQFEKEEFHDH